MGGETMIEKTEDYHRAACWKGESESVSEVTLTYHSCNVSQPDI